MTSPLNHEATRDFLEKHAWFGLSADQVDLFSQGVLPLLDEKGCKIEEAPGKWAGGPDGNGGALKALYQAGIGDNGALKVLSPYPSFSSIIPWQIPLTPNYAAIKLAKRPMSS